MLPDFLIIGAQKSGSTLVYRCLREHPDVFMPKGEVRFFEDPDYLRSDISQLEELFRNVTREQALGIKRPGYLARPECAQRIHLHLPEAKLIVILRNPVERAISAYYHLMKCGFIPIRPVEEGLRKILRGDYRDSHLRAEDIINFGFYHRHLMRYLEFFDNSQMLVMLLDAFKTDPHESIKQVYRFVGVDDDYVPTSLTMKRSQNPGVYTLTRLRLLAVRNLVMYTYDPGRAKRYRRKRKLLNRLVNRMVSETDRLLFAPIWGKSKPELSANLKMRLFEIYKEDIEELEGFLDQELTGWKRYAQEPSR